jgi:crotonobetainyl-CoA:carnitine CoA-transferase CaiB-like acyl-CoA transferase
MSETPPRIRGTAPFLGADNDYVFRDLLGLPDDEIARLVEARVIY